MNNHGSNWRDYSKQQQPEQESTTNPDLDDTTKYIIERAKKVRSKPIWQEEVEKARQRSGMPTKEQEEEEEKNRKVYDWENDTFLPLPSSQPPQGGKPDSTMMSTRTRGMLDKLKESTNALKDLNSQASEDVYDRMQYNPRGQRKTSQVRNQYQPDLYEPDRLADRVLSTSHTDYNQPQDYYSPRSRYSESQKREPSPPPPYQTRRRGYSPPPPNYQNERQFRSSPDPDRMGSAAWRDTEDVDMMIADLKKKTSGRDMRKVLRDLDTPGDNGYCSTPSYSYGYDKRGISNARDDDSNDYNASSKPYSYGNNNQSQNDDYGMSRYSRRPFGSETVDEPPRASRGFSSKRFDQSSNDDQYRVPQSYRNGSIAKDDQYEKPNRQDYSRLRAR